VIPKNWLTPGASTQAAAHATQTLSVLERAIPIVRALAAGTCTLLLSTHSFAESHSVRLEKCEEKLPRIESLYLAHSFWKADWGRRTVTPLEVYRSVGALEPSAISPISLYTYYPSSRGRWDSNVSKADKRRRWIDILAFPIIENSRLPTDAEIARQRALYEPTVGRVPTRVVWGLQELKVRREMGSGAFYQPRNRSEMVNGVPTFYCTTTTDDLERQSTCIGRLIVEPDIYVMYTFLQTLLPCWGNLEESVRRVVILNFNVDRAVSTKKKP
jgi:hypothetical protein